MAYVRTTQTPEFKASIKRITTEVREEAANRGRIDAKKAEPDGLDMEYMRGMSLSELTGSLAKKLTRLFERMERDANETIDGYQQEVERAGVDAYVEAFEATMAERGHMLSGIDENDGGGRGFRPPRKASEIEGKAGHYWDGKKWVKNPVPRHNENPFAQSAKRGRKRS